MKLFRYIKHEKGTVLGLLIISLLWVGMKYWMASWMNTSNGTLYVISLILSAICGAILFLVTLFFLSVIKNTWKNLDENIERARLQKEEKIKQCEEQERIASGKWEFPCDLFLQRCRQNKVTNIDNPFYFNKAKLLAIAVLKESSIPEEFNNLYINDEKIREYFLIGLQNEEAEEQRIQEEKQAKKLKEEQMELERQRVPQESTASKYEHAQLRNAAILITKYGREKRDTMLALELATLNEVIEQKIDEIKTKKKDAEAAQEAMLKLGVAVMSASQEPTKDWGLTAGVASAVAGPMAGAVVASDILRENQEIEMRNAQVRAQCSKHTAQMVNDITSSSDEAIVKIEKEKDTLLEKRMKIERQRELTQQKVVLENVGLLELKEFIKPRVHKIQRNKNNVTEVEIDIRNNYVPDVPEGVNIVVDGSFSVDIYSDSIHLGTANVPFPLYGLPCGKTTRVKALCPYFLSGDHKYKVKYTYHHLWAMEQ